jgi:hypothetical protein
MSSLRRRRRSPGETDPERAADSASRSAEPARGIPRYLQTISRDGNAATEQPEMSFPFASTIGAATGIADFEFAATLDPGACAERGVCAFTDRDNETRFASNGPDLHVAAHEATHQLQHAGRTNDANLGPEGHAHAVASAVTAGRAPAGLLGSEGASVAPSARDYTLMTAAEQVMAGEWQAGGNAMVGDQGRTVTTSADKHACYADPALVTEANAILRAKKSGVAIEPGGAGLSGMAPDGSGLKSTVKVAYKIVGDEDNEEFYADCGVSAREVMGGAGTDTSPAAVFTDAAGKRQETARSKDPADFRDEIYVRAGLGADRASAHAAYNALTAAEQEAFDQKHGINRYAAPGVGEAFTRRRDDQLGGSGYNFHWGSVIMVAGGDRVTFENYTKGEGYLAKDKDWYFATYGPPSKPGQTWHERWKSVGGAGKGTTLAAATSADPSPFTKATPGMSTADLIKKWKSSVEPGEKMALESEIRTRWLKVTVFVKKAQEGNDNVFVQVSHAGRAYESGEIELSSGQKNTFWIALERLAPITGKISVKVYDWDALSSNDLISILNFDDPYGPASDNRPWDDAEYHTTVEFDR